MEHKFWHEKWQDNDIAFHQDVPHPLLTKHFPALELETGSRVFVPLCGKSGDMIELRDQGYRVLGMELSEIAAQSFFEENRLEFESRQVDSYKHFQSGEIDILCGDFFELTPELLDGVAGVFDRAALIALPAEMRRAYVEKLQQGCRPGTRILLIALEYDDGLINPPPFAVREKEVRDHYGSWCDIELLEKAAAEIKGQPGDELVYRLDVRK